MFLKGYKEKSNQKFINKLIASRQAALSAKPIESVGVLLNVAEFDDFEAFRVFLGDLRIHQNKIKIIGFVETNQAVENSKETLFSKKQIGWRGKLKDAALEDFTNTAFDALISYYRNDTAELNLMTAKSRAPFKIGLSESDERLNDLILSIDPKNFELFKTELVKYLTILKKL
mgnify:CR=1 FL=1